MLEPLIVARYADNGSFSHWSLIQKETGDLLWSEAPEEEIQEVKKLNIPNVSGWIQLEGNESLFKIAANRNCWCLFDDESYCRYKETWPVSVMTHFKFDK